MILHFDTLCAKALAYSQENHSGYKSGVSNLDEIFRFEKGDFVVLCGSPNEGKSTFIQWYLYMMSINNQWKTSYLNFEGKQEETFLQILSYYKNIEQMKNYVSFCEIPNLAKIDQVIENIRLAKEIEDINCYVIDPYSNLLLGNVDTYTIAQDLAKLQAIGRELKVTIILLCHPPKNTEEINIYNIKGSSSFAERADIGLSIKRDYENNTTVIKVDKLRANGLRGKVKGEATLLYKDFAFIEVQNNDIPFGKYETITTQNVNYKNVLQNVIKAQEVPLERIKSTEVDIYTSQYEKTPYKRGKLIQSLFASDDDKQTLELINQIRSSDNKEEIRTLKSRLPMVMPTVKCGADKKDIKTYNNIICIDIDGKDNKDLTLDQIKEKVNTSPYVFYSAKSVSGKGLLALIYLDGNITDFEGHFNSLEKYFKKRGIIIDTQCKNPNRLRYITIDDNPYYNGHALIYTEKEQITQTVKNKSILQQNKIDLDKDKEKILKILEECKREKLIINPTHAETNKLSMIIAKYFGEEGFNIFMEFMNIKHKNYAEVAKYYTTYIKDTQNTISLNLGTLIYLLNNAKQNRI